MSKNLAILFMVLAVYTMSLGDSFTWQSELAIRSLISLAVAVTAISISKRPCALIVAGCEIIALVYNVCLTIGYSLDVPEIDRFYEVAMTALFATEVLALLLGMSDEFRRLQQNRKHRDNITRPTARNYFMGESLQ